MSRHLEHDWFPEPLPPNVQLGERSWLYSTYAFRHFQSRQDRGLTVGNDTGLYKGTFFDLGPDGEVVIGNFCTVVGAIICTNARVVIQDYALIAHDVVIADSPVSTPVWEPTKLTASASGYEPSSGVSHNSIFIGENVWICARAILLGGAAIGEGSIVGAGSVVDFNVPPFSIVAGNPARIVSEIRRNKNSSSH